jgi:electron transport complex protein RnfC
MRYFDVRQSGDLATGAPWPAEAPALKVLDLPPRLQVPLATAPPARPISFPAIGMRVTKGQRLCEPDGQSAPAILSPTSGRVVGSSMAEILNGATVPAVDIEPDFQDRPAPGQVHNASHAQEQHDQIEGLDNIGPRDLAAWIDRLRNGGVWAQRPSSPDLLAQLNRALRQPIDTIICNLLDDEPAMRLNGMLAARSGPMMLAGVGLLAKLIEARNLWLVAEAGTPAKWWSTLRRLARKTGTQIIPVLNDYPRSDPSLLLYALQGRRLKPGRLPVEQKVLMLDAAAAITLGRFLTRAQPMLQVPMAIRDHVHQRTHFVVATVGSPLRHVLQQCEAPADDVTLRRGSVLRENNISADAVVSGGELSIHVMPRQLAPIADPCIRCSWCVESCPTRVQPAGLLEASQRGDMELANYYGLDGCIECGVCTYVCPSRLPLLRGIRNLKSVQLNVHNPASPSAMKPSAKA